MSGAMEKSLAILEFLANYPDGATLAEIATALNQIRSGCHRTLGELIRFGSVGFTTLGLYAVLMWILSATLDAPMVVRATISYIPCILANYLLQRAFTFRSQKQHVLAGPRYIIVQLGGLIINSGVLWLTVDVEHWPYWAGQAAALAGMAAWSFVGQKFWAFS